MDQYGLIGYPLGHSFSAKFFDQYFRTHSIKARYTLFEMPSLEGFMDLIEEYALVGLNVTAPYKEEVLRYCDDLSPCVEYLRAANVLKIDRADGSPRLEAHNTDVIGFGESLRRYGDRMGERAFALILGTGGAARAVGYVLRMMGLRYAYVSRSPQAHPLLDADCLGYEEANLYIKEASLIVNATPIGYDLADAPRIDYSQIGEGHICYDLIYNPSETRFLSLSREQGAETQNGLEMLHLQALEAWHIWEYPQKL